MMFTHLKKILYGDAFEQHLLKRQLSYNPRKERGLKRVIFSKVLI